MSYTLSHIKKQITTHGFLWCRVYDSQKKCVLFINDNAYPGLTPEKMVELINDFATDVPGRYQFDFKKTAKHGKASIMTFMNVSCYDGPNIPIPVIGSEDKVDEAAIRKRIRAEFEADNLKKKMQEDSLELKRQMDELQTAGGKLYAMLSTLFSAFSPVPLPTGQLQGIPNNTHMGRLADLKPTHPQQPQAQQPYNPNYQQPQPNVQGMPNNPTGYTQQHQHTPPQAQPQQGYVPGTYFDASRMSDADLIRCNICLEKLLSRMDVNTLEAFTNRIYSDPAIVQSLKAFL